MAETIQLADGHVAMTMKSSSWKAMLRLLFACPELRLASLQRWEEIPAAFSDVDDDQDVKIVLDRAMVDDAKVVAAWCGPALVELNELTIRALAILQLDA